MIALDLDHVAAQRAARTAQTFELARELFQLGRRFGDANDQRDRLTPATFSIAHQPHESVLGKTERARCRLLPLRARLATRTAVAVLAARRASTWLRKI
jgi:hypothetical protein